MAIRPNRSMSGRTPGVLGQGGSSVEFLHGIDSRIDDSDWINREKPISDYVVAGEDKTIVLKGDSEKTDSRLS